MKSKILPSKRQTPDATAEIKDKIFKIQEVNENVAQASSATGEVAADIAGVGQVSSEINSSTQVHTNAEELRELAERLTAMVSQFKV